MEIDLFMLMKNNKKFMFNGKTTTDLEELTIVINKDYFKKEYIGNFKIAFIEDVSEAKDGGKDDI